MFKTKCLVTVSSQKNAKRKRQKSGAGFHKQSKSTSHE